MFAQDPRFSVPRFEVGPEPETALSFTEYQQDDGRLSGANMLDLAAQDPGAAVRILASFVEALPEVDRPPDGEGLLGLVNWENHQQREEFRKLLAEEEK